MFHDNNMTLQNTENILQNTNKILDQISQVRKDIQSAVTPKFIELSIKTNEMIELSIEIWKLEKKLNLLYEDIIDHKKESIDLSINKIKRYLTNNDIQILDPTNQLFNDDRNFDILLVEKGDNISETIVKETKEPTILYKGKIVRKAKVIILEKSSGDKHG